MCMAVPIRLASTMKQKPDQYHGQATLRRPAYLSEYSEPPRVLHNFTDEHDYLPYITATRSRQSTAAGRLFASFARLAPLGLT